MNQSSTPTITTQDAEAAYAPPCLYIDGAFIAADGERTTQNVINPATGQAFAQLPHATTADLDRALAAAARAFDNWRTSSPMERSRVLRHVAQLIRERAAENARNVTLEMGKPLAEAKLEMGFCAETCEWYAEECRRLYGRVIPPRVPNVRQLVLREPVGVCAAFSPWNFPFSQAIRQIAGAIGSGCTIIIKGPEDAPSALVAIARMFHDAGLPPGVLNVVWGVPGTVSEHLIRSPIVRKISFTGSVPVGKQLASLAGAHMKRMTMELGGHSPTIVFDDADVDRAADILAAYKFRNAGQVCLTPSRFFIQDTVYDRFMARFLDKIKTIRVGNGLLPDTSMGPLAHDRRLAAMQTFMEDAHTRGGRIETGGERIGAQGCFFAPTIVSELPDDSLMMTTETFGPLAACLRFKDIDEVITRANALPYGLASYAFTTNTRRALRIQNDLQAGLVYVNHAGTVSPEMPIGGVKDSGIGSEGGIEGYESYLATKFVTQMD